MRVNLTKNTYKENFLNSIQIKTPKKNKHISKHLNKHNLQDFVIGVGLVW